MVKVHTLLSMLHLEKLSTPTTQLRLKMADVETESRGSGRSTAHIIMLASYMILMDIGWRLSFNSQKYSARSRREDCVLALQRGIYGLRQGWNFLGSKVLSFRQHSNLNSDTDQLHVFLDNLPK